MINQDKLSPTDVSLPNYSYEFCPMEGNSDGTLIYTRNHLSYKNRND